MNWDPVIVEALGLAAIGSTLLLLVGSAALGWLPAPGERLRVATWTLTAAALAPLAALAPQRPLLMWHILPAGAAPASALTPPEAPPASPPREPPRLPAAQERSERLAARANSARIDAAPLRTACAIDWPAPLLALYLGGCLIVLGRSAAASLAARRLARGGREASPDVTALWRELAGPLAHRVPLRVDSRRGSPRLLGWPTRCVLVPAPLLADAAGLRLALAHELAHLRHGDLRRWTWISLCCTALWFQPLAWRLRREVRESQDQLADDAAAGDQRAEYAAFLLTAARWLVEARAWPGLAMAAGPSTLQRRITTLLAGGAAKPVRLTTLLGIGCLLAMLTLACLTLRVAQARHQARHDDARVDAVRRVPVDPAIARGPGTVRVIDAATRRPLAGAAIVEVRSQPGTPGVQDVANLGLCNAQGELTVPEALASFRVSRDGYLTKFTSPRTEQESLRVVELFPATTITGVVTCEGGPLAGARVATVSGDLDDFSKGHLEQGETDAQGRFAIDLIRGSDAELLIRTDGGGLCERHFERPQGDVGEIHVATGTTASTNVLTGRVLGHDGRPVHGILLNIRLASDDRAPELLSIARQLMRGSLAGSIRGVAGDSTRTARDGSYRLGPLPHGTYWVTARSPGLEWAGTHFGERVTIDDDPASLEVRLTPTVAVEVQLVRADGAILHNAEVRWSGTTWDRKTFSQLHVSTKKDGTQATYLPATWKSATLDVGFQRSDLRPGETVQMTLRLDGETFEQSSHVIDNRARRLRLELPRSSPRARVE